ncbi:PIR protein CIR protein [Plasmodium vinckei lentum]|uniref:PIR protein CIR protein n=1 Tax=Plasmodium vinckei lentum TaxID=138297 RepID=A0A6V7S2S3_PLAVN|nr:PIR protein CIR protein [Plasmodium vinckei lentum]
MAIKACKLLREVDGYFNNEIVDVAKFDKSNLFEYKCPYDRINKNFRKCENNYERINTLGGYLYEKLAGISKDFKGKGDNGNRHIEIFIMWLSDKLYKLEENKIRTVKQFYENHLEKYMPNFNYWRVIDSKKEYKRANVWYMSELYKLLNCICNIVIEYNKNPHNMNTKVIGTMSKKCYQKFTSIYKDIKDCYSYFHLLKYLKNIYDGIRNDAIKKAANKRAAIIKAAKRKAVIKIDTINKNIVIPPNTNLSKLLGYAINASTTSLIDLTTPDWNQRFPNESDHIIDFHTQACVKSYSELVQQVEKDISKDTPASLSQPGSDQSGKEGNKEPSDRSKAAQNKHDENSHKQKQQTLLQALTSLSTDQQTTNSHQMDQQSPPKPQKQDPQPPNQPTDKLQKTPSPSVSETSLGNSQESLNKSPKDPSNGQADSENAKKLLKFLICAQNTFEKYRSPFYEIYTDINKRIHESISSALKNANTNSIYIVNKVNSAIKQVSEQLQKPSTPAKEENSPPDHKDSEPKTPLSSSTDPQSPNSQPTNPSTNISLNDQKSVSTNSNNLLANLVTDTGIKKSTQKVVLLGNIFKGEVPTYVKTIVILIPIILGITYKYLSYGWRKELKRKKNMKKVINSIGGKRPMQIIIKPGDAKKMKSPIINPIRGGKKSLLNIYKFMQSDPVPFINLFFLLIFFVYKRKLNYLEL